MTEMNREEITELVTQVVNDTVAALSEKHIIGTPHRQERTAYQQTEQLLYNLNGFKKIIAERMEEIEELRKHGVPQKSKSITQYCAGGGGVNPGVVTEEESVENAVRTVQASVQGTVQAVCLIEKCMKALEHDPYYKILEMRYLEGRTQEDMAVEFDCTQQNISYHRRRLVNELAMRLFPDKVMSEYMN